MATGSMLLDGILDWVGICSVVNSPFGHTRDNTLQKKSKIVITIQIDVSKTKFGMFVARGK